MKWEDRNHKARGRLLSEVLEGGGVLREVLEGGRGFHGWIQDTYSYSSTILSVGGQVIRSGSVALARAPAFTHGYGSGFHSWLLFEAPVSLYGSCCKMSNIPVAIEKSMCKPLLNRRVAVQLDCLAVALMCRSHVQNGSPQLNDLLANLNTHHLVHLVAPCNLAQTSCTRGMPEVVIGPISQQVVESRAATLHMASTSNATNLRERIDLQLTICWRNGARKVECT